MSAARVLRIEVSAASTLARVTGHDRASAKCEFRAGRRLRQCPVMPGLPRRSLLRGLGIGLVAAPFLNLLSAPRSRAEGAAARRLIVFFSPNGTVPKHWAPSGSETDFSFPAGSILEPLTPVQDKLIVVEGLDFFGADNHEGGMMAMLTASGGLADESGGASLDQFVAGKIGQDSRFASLEFGVQTSAWGAGVQTRMSYSAPGAWVSPDDDPAHVYSRLFGDFMGGDQADPEASEQTSTGQSHDGALSQAPPRAKFTFCGGAIVARDSCQVFGSGSGDFFGARRRLAAGRGPGAR